MNRLPILRAQWFVSDGITRGRYVQVNFQKIGDYYEAFGDEARTRVFTVPSGAPVRAAISLCVIPSKYASSTACRCSGARLASAAVTLRINSAFESFTANLYRTHVGTIYNREGFLEVSLSPQGWDAEELNDYRQMIDSDAA